MTHVHRPGSLSRSAFCWLALGALAALPSFAAAAVSEPDGYRNDAYLAPVPETLKGATVVDTDKAFELWDEGKTVFVDVYPQAPKPANLSPEVIWRDKPRETIKGAVWLPNTGYGKLPPHVEDFFRMRLEQLTDSDKQSPVMFFCQQDCWMSWNAAKRALEYGYGKVYWYPDGIDGWAFADHPLESLKGEFAPGP